MDKNKILSGVFFILGLMPIAGAQYLPADLSMQFASNPYMPYVSMGIGFALSSFFAWRAKKQYAKAVEQANQQMAQAQAQYQQQTQVKK